MSNIATPQVTIQVITSYLMILMIILQLTYYSCYASYLLSTSPSQSSPQNTGLDNLMSSADDDNDNYDDHDNYNNDDDDDKDDDDDQCHSNSPDFRSDC